MKIAKFVVSCFSGEKIAYIVIKVAKSNKKIAKLSTLQTVGTVTTGKVKELVTALWVSMAKKVPQNEIQYCSFRNHSVGPKVQTGQILTKKKPDQTLKAEALSVS